MLTSRKDCEELTEPDGACASIRDKVSTSQWARLSQLCDDQHALEQSAVDEFVALVVR